MKKYEYKTITIKFRIGFFKKRTPDISEMLNREGAQGWKLNQMILPAATFGESEQMIAILEREVVA